MKKKIAIIMSIVLIFTLTGCGGNNKSNDSTKGNSNNDNENKVIEKENKPKHDFVPQKAVPNNLPVYPDAILWSDTETWTTEGTNWMWLYNTTASANEIIDFFTTELQNLGFEIDPKFTFANYEEFFVRDTTKTVEVGWMDDGIEDVNPDTSGRGYMIIVNLDKWNER